MIGRLAGAGAVIHEEFREGNIAPASGNLEFIKSCEAHLPKGRRIANVRLDSAGECRLLPHWRNRPQPVRPVQAFRPGRRLVVPPMATVRWRLFHLPGRVVRHAGALALKVAARLVELFRDIRSKSYQMAQALAP